ncbi:MAG: redox-sensing transcriptional repressor Rex [Acidimicrobiia bacterium]|nr:redox-sensing transcriptional repressor Rex [Acidimicrobiia bacterium]
MAQPLRRIPDATVARLPEYLRVLGELAENQVRTVSSRELADLAGVNAAKVRKDLSFLGSYGTRGVGYEVGHLLFEMRRALGLTDRMPVIVVGAGNLGSALAKNEGFGERGFPVVAIVDNDPEKIGVRVGKLEVRPEEELAELVEHHAARIGIIAVPPAAAQGVAELLVEAGVASILNFAPVLVNVSSDVPVRRVDLALELQVLSFYTTRPDAEAPIRRAARPGPPAP